MKELLATGVFLASPVIADQSVKIDFAAEIGGQPFKCISTYDGLGASETTVIARDFKAYLSNIVLVSVDGSSTALKLDESIWQNESVALLDFEDGSDNCVNGTPQTNTSISGTAPEGDYVGVRFNVGVPFEKNHADPTAASSPLNLTSMFWNWQAGYKFIRIDFVPTERTEDAPVGWFFHLGSTMCKAESRTEAPAQACMNPNVMNVSLDAFNSETDTIVIDPAALVSEVDLSMNTLDTSPGCMSFPNDPECTTVMVKLGLDYMDLPARNQQLFSVR